MPTEPSEWKPGDTRILIVNGKMLLQVKSNAMRSFEDGWIDVPSVVLMSQDHLTYDFRGQLTLQAWVEPISLHVVSLLPELAPIETPHSHDREQAA